MKERGINMRSHEVRAILDGRKTQARRIVKPQPDYVNKLGIPFYPNGKGPVDYRLYPYGGPGDRLWVKETFRLFDSHSECACYDICQCSRFNGKPIYRADQTGFVESGKWKPSTQMPRWASRIILEIVSVRTERLQDITEEDAKAEGSEFGFWHPLEGVFTEPTDEDDEQNSCFRDGFGFIWESVNGPGSWDLNQWVWVIEFKEVKP